MIEVSGSVEPPVAAGGGSESASAGGGSGARSLGLPRISGGTGAPPALEGGSPDVFATVFFGLFFALRSAISCRRLQGGIAYLGT